MESGWEVVRRVHCELLVQLHCREYTLGVDKLSASSHLGPAPIKFLNLYEADWRGPDLLDHQRQKLDRRCKTLKRDMLCLFSASETSTLTISSPVFLHRAGAQLGTSRQCSFWRL